MTTRKDVPGSAAKPEVAPTRARRNAGAVVAIAMVPFLALGLLDPLEGGMALLVALGLGVVVRVLSLVPIPRFAWLSALTALVLGVAALLVAFATNDEKPSGETIISTPTTILVIGYEIAALATLVGGVVYAVRVVRAARQRQAAP